MCPRPLLHLEGAAVLTASLFAYQWSHGSWLQFPLLFLLPDLAMLGLIASGPWCRALWTSFPVP